VSKKMWTVVASRKQEKEDTQYELKRLAELLRGIKPQQRGGFHSPCKKAEENTLDRHQRKESLKQEVRKYNAKDSDTN